MAGSGHETNAVKATATANVKSTEGKAQLNFNKHNFIDRSKDSVLVIYDRYDRSGAGIIHKVYYPSTDNTVSISGIPEGKYYVTIQFLGLHRERFEKVMKIKSNKCESISIKLNDYDEYQKDNVVIPSETTDFSHLKITSMK